MTPNGTIWLLLALGRLSLAWRRWPRSAAWLGVSTLVLFLVGSAVFVDRLLRG